MTTGRNIFVYKRVYNTRDQTYVPTGKRSVRFENVRKPILRFDFKRITISGALYYILMVTFKLIIRV